jgi:hypothetical protein
LARDASRHFKHAHGCVSPDWDKKIKIFNSVFEANKKISENAISKNRNRPASYLMLFNSLPS